MARNQGDSGQYSILGRLLGINDAGQLIRNGIPLHAACLDASVTVSAEGATTADVRDILITLKDADGNAIDYVEEVEIAMFLDAARVAYVVTGGSTGLEFKATYGALQTIVAKKRFRAVSSAAGLIALKWTDSGTEVAFLGIKLPSGRWVMSSALTNA